MRNGPERTRPPYLPDGFALDETTDPDLVTLRRAAGSEVAAFGERADPKEIERLTRRPISRKGDGMLDDRESKEAKDEAKRLLFDHLSAVGATQRDAKRDVAKIVDLIVEAAVSEVNRQWEEKWRRQRSMRPPHEF